MNLVAAMSYAIYEILRVVDLENDLRIILLIINRIIIVKSVRNFFDIFGVRKWNMKKL